MSLTMTQPSIRPFRSATMAPESLTSSIAMASAVSRNAPDSGSSLPRYSSNAAAMVAAIAGASAAVAPRRTRVSLMVGFLSRLARHEGKRNGLPDHRSEEADAGDRRGDLRRRPRPTARQPDLPG